MNRKRRKNKYSDPENFLARKNWTLKNERTFTILSNSSTRGNTFSMICMML